MGSALSRRLQGAGYRNLTMRSHDELDLTHQQRVQRFFETEQPEFVFLAAARVGGILANATYPADFIAQNLFIQTNIIHEAYRAGVKRLLFLGSSCIYPKYAAQPIEESSLLTGPLEPTNRPYSLAKIAGIELCWSYNRQYGTQFLAAMPTNLFGPGDRYDLQDSHVIPALIRKMHEAKINGAQEVSIWGTGGVRREFLYSDDAADACVFLMNLADAQLNVVVRQGEERPVLNVGCGQDLTIREAAELIAVTVGFKGRLVYDHSKPDGTPRKLLNINRLTALGWRAQTSFEEGLRKTYADFLSNAASTIQLNLTATNLP